MTLDISTPRTPRVEVRRRDPLSVPLILWLAVAAVLLVLAAVGPLLVGDVTTTVPSARLLAPGQDGHLLGTDGQGRDIAGRLIAGTRPSILTGLIPVLLSGVVGLGLGVWAGMGGRAVHTAIMRIMDVFYAFPAVLLAIAIASSLGAGTTSTILALTIVFIPPVARLAESETLRLRELDFMVSARTTGANGILIATRHVLPNIAPQIVVYCTSLVAMALVFGGGLSFLGLGVAPPLPEWGSMISEARAFMFSSPHVALIPALAVTLAAITFTALGDALSDRWGMGDRA